MTAGQLVAIIRDLLYLLYTNANKSAGPTERNICINLPKYGEMANKELMILLVATNIPEIAANEIILFIRTIITDATNIKYSVRSVFVWVGNPERQIFGK